MCAQRKVNWYFVVGDHKCKWRDLPKDNNFYMHVYGLVVFSSCFFSFSIVFVSGKPLTAHDGRTKNTRLANNIESFRFFGILSIVINSRCETVCRQSRLRSSFGHFVIHARFADNNIAPMLFVWRVRTTSPFENGQENWYFFVVLSSIHLNLQPSSQFWSVEWYKNATIEDTKENKMNESRKETVASMSPPSVCIGTETRTNENARTSFRISRHVFISMLYTTFERSASVQRAN